jgi:hypothetical protein
MSDNKKLTDRITLYKVSNFSQISVCYTRIKYRWKIFQKVVSGNGWKPMGWAVGPAVAYADAIRGAIMDY